MIEYRLNKKTGIVYSTIKGETTVKDFIEYIISLSKDETIPKVLKIITDASEGRFSKTVKPEEMKEIVEANKKYLLSKIDYLYDAIILSSSFETALAYIYKNHSENYNFSFEIFAEKKAAEKWLNQF